MSIAEMRRTAGLTQIQLAIEAECSRSSIAILEAGYQPRHSDVLPRLLAILRPYNDVETAGNGLHEQEVRGADAINPAP